MNGSTDIKYQLKRLSALKEKLSGTKPGELNNKTKVFISVGYKESRAVVFTGIGNTFDTAYKSAQDKAVKHIKAQSSPPPWLKADLATAEWELSMDEFTDLASKIKRYYFQYGISLDDYYNAAFLPQEINAACLIIYNEKAGYAWEENEKIDGLAGRYKEGNSFGVKASLNAGNIKPYLGNSRKQQFNIEPDKLKKVIIFETASYFCDGDDYYEMDNLPLCRDRRKIDELTPPMIKDLLQKSADYLTTTVQEDGRFIYGYFACYNRIVPTYNTIRHALGVYGLAETYLVTGEQSLLPPMKRSLDYLINEFAYHVDDCCFLADFENGNEIRLGAMSVGMLAIIRYLEIFDEKEHYLPLLRKLGNGILYMQDFETGQFTHVLRYPSLELVDEFRIVYYSGEASFALMRLYGIDKNEKWLNAVKKAFDFFIANDYWKYNDHWLAYCTNELAAVAPDDRYFEFGLKNAFYKLDFIIDRLTTWPTFLEMLTASHTMIENIKNANKEHLFQGYDIEKFMGALKIRAMRQLNGVFFPETAMYFKSPKTIMYGIFVRHHTFRMRNDDVAHHLSGYCHYLTDVISSKSDK